MIKTVGVGVKCRNAKFLVRFSLQRSSHCLLLKSKVFFEMKLHCRFRVMMQAIPPLLQKKKNKNKNKEKKKEMRFSLDDIRECKALCAEYFFLL